MKLYSLLVCVFFYTSACFAQSKEDFRQKATQEKNAVLQLILAQNDAPKLKTTSSVGERLIGTASYTRARDSSGMLYFKLIGTAELGYSGNRGSHFDLNFMQYDGSYYFYWDQGYGFGYVRGDMPVNYSKNNKPSVSPDFVKSTTPYYTGPTSTPPTSPLCIDSIHYDYNGDGNVLVCYDTCLEACPGGIWTVFNEYNADGNILNMSMLPHYSTYTEPRQRNFFYYADGNLAYDSTTAYSSGVPRATDKITYQYNADGNVSYMEHFMYSSGSVSGYSSYMFSYYSPGKIKALIFTRLGGWGDTFVTNDSFGWSPDGRFINYYRTDYVPDIMGAYRVMEKSVIPAIQMPDSMVYYLQDRVTGARYRSSAFVYDYDAMSYPIRNRYYGSYNSSTGNFDSLYDDVYYYYETYDNTAVNGIVKSCNVKIAPNPTADLITVSFDGVAVGSEEDVRITDIMGRTVYSKRINWNGVPEKIDLRSLATGVYSFMAEDVSSCTAYRQQILKQ